ncbi:MAG: serine hydrolase [Alphaproteobacteria bacterium]|nr:serine hydrolase [Alphaproteobacteria bacterium]
MSKRLGWLVFPAAFFAWSTAALAQEAAGDWVGTLRASALVIIHFAVHIKPTGHGGLQGTMDSPEQNMSGLALSDISAREGALSFKVPAAKAVYSGRWDAAAHDWLGEWRQWPTPFPLTFARPSAGPAHPASAWTIPSDAEIGRLLDARIAARPGEGIVVGIITPEGRRIVARGPTGAPPFNGRTLFELGSITKVFTGLLLADMARTGEVKLDDPADTYLPAGVTLPERNGRKITLLDLATHHSGLPRLPKNMNPKDPDNPYADYSEQDLFAGLKQIRLTRDIGSEFEYSNLGVALLGDLLARRAGTDYATLLRHRITGPLGMKDTMVGLSPDQKARLAQPHDEYMRPTPPWDFGPLPGAGGLRSDVDDLLTLLGAALGRVRGPLAEDLAAMRVPRADIFPPTVRIGIVLNLMKTPIGEIVSHTGATEGSRTFLGFDPARRRGVVVLVNGAPDPASDDIGLYLLTGTPLMPLQPIPKAPRAWPVVTLSSAQLDRLTGRYRVGPQEILTVTRDGNQLLTQRTGTQQVRIFPSSETEFFLKVLDAQLSFVLDASGRASKVVLHHGGQDVTAEREP